MLRNVGQRMEDREQAPQGEQHRDVEVGARAPTSTTKSTTIDAPEYRLRLSGHVLPTMF